MTDGPVEWVEEAFETDSIDPDSRPQDWFKNWWAFSEGTKRDITNLFYGARGEELERVPVAERIGAFMRMFDPRRW